MQSDAVYFSRRAHEERAVAREASRAKAREAHLQMAERYDELAAAIAAREPEQSLRATA